MVLAANRELQAIQREAMARMELPQAQIAAVLANVNRDPSKGQPFTTQQFCIYQAEDKQDEGLRPEVAAVALALRHENRLPSMVLMAWQQILEASKAACKAPAVRALRSDDDAVWVLAPRWEDGNVRGGLVSVKGPISGAMVLRELDRPLLTYRLKVPERKGFGWLESDLLLVRAS